MKYFVTFFMVFSFQSHTRPIKKKILKSTTIQASRDLQVFREQLRNLSNQFRNLEQNQILPRVRALETDYNLLKKKTSDSNAPTELSTTKEVSRNLQVFRDQLRNLSNQFRNLEQNQILPRVRALETDYNFCWEVLFEELNVETIGGADLDPANSEQADKVVTNLSERSIIAAKAKTLKQGIKKREGR